MSNDTVDIIQLEGKRSFTVLIGTARLFVNLDELKQMVRIAGAASGVNDGARRLYAWMCRERKDMILDGGVNGPGDAALKELFSIILDRFTVD